MTESRLLQGLNPPQREVVQTTDGPLLVIAGAGSGKTRVITHRIAWLIEEKGISPHNIFAATFTNKAAREMKDRVARLCLTTEMSTLAIATFHSQCATIMRSEAENLGLTPKFTICDATDQRALMRDILREFNHDPKQLKPQDVLGVVSLAKMKLLDGKEAEEYIANARDDEHAKLYRRYQERLRASDAVDFDDLLLLVVKLWRQYPDILRRYQTMFRYLLVDEYQDTNLAQFEVVRLLSSEHRNLCVVGDEDQSIYSWRGAELSNLLEFEKHFEEAKIIRLEQNYRSTATILEAADCVIQHNSQRLGKTLWTDGDAGDPVIVIDARDERDEARQIANELLKLQAAGHMLEECAIFYRVNALSRVYEEALRDNGIPYQVVGNVGFYDRMEIKDLLCYLQVIANPGNDIAMLRIINKPRRSLGQKSVQRIVDTAEANQCSIFEIIAGEDKLGKAGIKGKGQKSALALAQMIIQWNAEADSKSLYSLGKSILRKTEYVESLGDQKDIEVLSRKENIDELIGAMKQWDENSEDEEGLEEYLESVALREATDVMYKEGAHTGVSLMTIHNAKGLEFDHVFAVALERDIFPNQRALQEQGHAEEERRLFYVALTRARKRFYVSHARMRRLYGETSWPTVSPFVREIPEELRQPIEEAKLDRIRFRPTAEETSQGKMDRLSKAREDLEAIIRRKRNQPAVPNSSTRFSNDPSPTPPGSRPGGPVDHAGRTPATRVKKSKPKVGGFYEHPILGEVEIIEEKGFANNRTFTVKDSEDKTHTLIANFAKLTPVETRYAKPETREPSENEEIPFLEPSPNNPTPVEDESDDDALPF